MPSAPRSATDSRCFDRSLLHLADVDAVVATSTTSSRRVGRFLPT